MLLEMFSANSETSYLQVRNSAELFYLIPCLVATKSGKSQLQKSSHRSILEAQTWSRQDDIHIERILFCPRPSHDRFAVESGNSFSLLAKCSTFSPLHRNGVQRKQSKLTPLDISGGILVLDEQ